jgi:hypothetical protein
MGKDIRKLDIFRSRLPMNLFEKIYTDVHVASVQYGRMQDHENEEARSRYIASVSGLLNQFPHAFKFNTDRFIPKLCICSEVRLPTNQRGCWILSLPEGEESNIISAL